MKCIKLRTKYIIIIGFIVIKLVLQLIATANSGYHGDELLHIEAGKHLAFGYMDFPPFIGIISWIQNLFHSDSLYLNHLFNYLNSILIFLICGLITIRLGGGILAVIITESALLFSPGFGATQYLFLPTAFEQLFWVLIIYLVIEFCITQNAKYLIHIGLYAALGFLTKYSTALLLTGFMFSVLFFKRELLVKRITWIAFLVFIILILPNLFWQFKNNFPVFHHMSELYKSQLAKQSFLKELSTLILFLNPFTLIIWLSGLLIVPFNSKYKDFKLPTFTLLFSFLFLMLLKGKSYYFFPIILSLLAFGSVYFERLIQNKKWIAYSYLFLLISFGVYLLPHGLPLLKLEKYVATYNLTPNNDNKIPLAFENYYSNENWGRIIKSVSNAHNSLTSDEKKHCLVWGRHYSMAGGINLFGINNNLPNAFSFHSSLYMWIPDFDKDVVVITIGESNYKKSNWEQYFDKVEEAGIIENHYASDKSWYNYQVFICRGIKYNSDELKQLFKNQIF